MSAKTKTCTACGKVKAVGAFYRQLHRCKTCVNARQLRYQQANPEKMKVFRRKYYEAHRKEISDKRAKRYAANREQIAEYLNREEIREQRQEYARQYRETNREQIRKKQRLTRANLKKGNGEKSDAVSITGKSATPRVSRPASSPPVLVRKASRSKKAR